MKKGVSKVDLLGKAVEYGIQKTLPERNGTLRSEGRTFGEK